MLKIFKRTTSYITLISVLFASVSGFSQELLSENYVTGGPKEYFYSSYTFAETKDSDEKIGNLKYTEPYLSLVADGEGYIGVPKENNSFTLDVTKLTKNENGEDIDKSLTPAKTQQTWTEDGSFGLTGYPHHLSYDETAGKWYGASNADHFWTINDGCIYTGKYVGKNGTDKAGKMNIKVGTNIIPKNSCKELVISFKTKAIETLDIYCCSCNGEVNADSHSVVSVQATKIGKDGTSLPSANATVTVSEKDSDGWCTVNIVGCFKRSDHTDTAITGNILRVANAWGEASVKDLSVMTLDEYNSILAATAANRNVDKGKTSVFTTMYYSEATGEMANGILNFDLSQISQEESSALYVTLEYFDNNTAPLKVSYISDENGTVSQKEIIREGINEWRTGTIEIPKAYLKSMFNNGVANFSILSDGNDTYIHRISVSNAQPSDGDALITAEDEFDFTIDESVLNDKGYITGTFELPVEFENFDVEWESSNNSIISISGVNALVEPSFDEICVVTLTAKIIKNDVYITKDFVVTVAKASKKSPVISNVSLTDNGNGTTTVRGKVSQAHNIGVITLVAVAKDADGVICDIDTDSFNSSVKSEDVLATTVQVGTGETVNYYFITDNNSSLKNAAPSGVQNFSVTPADGNIENLELSWEKSMDDFNNVKTYYLTSNVTGVTESIIIEPSEGRTDEKGNTVFSKVFSGLLSNEEYFFTLRAEDHEGLSSETKQLSVVIPESVMVDFSKEEVVYDNIEFVDSSTEGSAYSIETTVGEDNRKCRQTAWSGGKRSHLYFSVNKDIISSECNEVTFEVTYYDDFGSGSKISITYNNDNNSNSKIDLIEGTSTNTWKTAAVTVADACLSNSKNTSGKLWIDSDFRIETNASNNKLSVSKVRVMPALKVVSNSKKSLKKKTITDPQTGREYNWMNFNEGTTVRNYFNKQEWNSDGTKFIFGDSSTGAMYEYNVETENVKFLDYASVDGVLNAVVAPTNEIFYNKENGDIWKIDWNTYEKKEIAKIPAPYTNIGHLSVTDDGKHLSCSLRKVVQSGSYSGPLAFVDVKTGMIEMPYSHRFEIAYDGTGHPIINPKNRNLLFFCHEGDSNLVNDRMWLYDKNANIAENILVQSEGEKVGHEAWDADGNDLYFVKYSSSTDGGKKGLLKINKDSKERTYFNDEYNYWHAHPSFDERWIVADTNDLPNRKIVVVNTSTKASQVLAAFPKGPSSEHPYQPHPTFNRNNKFITWSMCDENNTLGIAWMDVSDLTQ